MSTLENKHVPWDTHTEILVWFVAIVISTFLVHNIMTFYKEHR